jgi:hypothetical protein
VEHPAGQVTSAADGQHQSHLVAGAALRAALREVPQLEGSAGEHSCTDCSGNAACLERSTRAGNAYIMPY